jgi:hypothetical protein
MRRNIQLSATAEATIISLLAVTSALDSRLALLSTAFIAGVSLAGSA